VTEPLVLVVEDEEVLRRLIVRMLSRLGYRVKEAADGEEGLTRAKDHPESFSLILSDVVMPRLSGPEMVAHLRESGDETPVAFMSGYSGDALEPAEEYGNLLPKPFTMEELRDFVREALSG